MKFLTVAVILIHLTITARRLPEWNSNKTIWVAAVEVEPLDPWCLDNAAHFTHNSDKRAAGWLVKFTSLKIPAWLPVKEREPYRIGLKSLADSLKASNYEVESDRVNNKLNELMLDRKMVIGYVTQ